MNPSVITCHGVTKNFGETKVLKGIDLNIPHGSIVGLVGTNGSGKSTLIKCLIGLLKVTSGKVTVRGEDPWDLSTETKKRLGYVPQVIKLYPWMRVSQVINYTGAFYENWDGEHCKSLLQLWQLDGSKWIKTLSGGELQRLAIILALGHKPSLLILDEPAASLDPIGRRSFLKSLLEMNLPPIITYEDLATQTQVFRLQRRGNQRPLNAWNSQLESLKSMPRGWLRSVRLDSLGEPTMPLAVWISFLVMATVYSVFTTRFSVRSPEPGMTTVCAVAIALVIPLLTSLSRRDTMPVELLYPNSRAQFIRLRMLSIAAKYSYLFAAISVYVTIVQYFHVQVVNLENIMRAVIMFIPITTAATGLVLWCSSIRNIFALGLLVVVGLVILICASFSYLDFRWIQPGKSGEQIHNFVSSPQFYAVSYLVAGLLLWTGYHRLSGCEVARQSSHSGEK